MFDNLLKNAINWWDFKLMVLSIAQKETHACLQYNKWHTFNLAILMKITNLQSLLTALLESNKLFK